jgi:hypothetical protein
MNMSDVAVKIVLCFTFVMLAPCGTYMVRWRENLIHFGGWGGGYDYTKTVEKTEGINALVGTGFSIV